MAKKEKHEIARDTILIQADRIERNVNTALDVLGFMANWNDDNREMIAYVQQKLNNILPSLSAMSTQAERLAEFADPSAPEDLPF